jgi:hypothetical protein
MPPLGSTVPPRVPTLAYQLALGGRAMRPQKATLLKWDTGSWPRYRLALSTSARRQRPVASTNDPRLLPPLQDLLPGPRASAEEQPDSCSHAEAPHWRRRESAESPKRNLPLPCRCR